MLNVFSKTKPWMVASLLAASSLFAQSNMNNDKCRTAPKPPEPMPAPMTAAYNAPARVDVRGCWDLYLSASFIYWQPTQDNMEFAVSSSGTSMAGTTTAPVNNTFVNLNPNYKPGFEVMGGMNFDYDNWDSSVMYTWFHNTNSNSTTAPTGGSVFATLAPAGFAGDSTAYSSARANWNLKMDIADWVLGRSYYVGTKLTFRPYFGARAAWIRQKYSTTYNLTASSNSASYKSTSWGIGAEAGMTANYLFGYGFRVFGDLEGDVLFTRYHSNVSATNTVVSPADTLSTKQSGINTVRPHTNIDLGIAWASYFDNNNWHVDFMASYGFQVFWNQNMFRHFNDHTQTANSTMPNGDLFVQGLTLTARLDF